MTSRRRLCAILTAVAGVVSCDPGQPRAVIGVVFTDSKAVQVAQEMIAETAQAGEPVILLQHDTRTNPTVDEVFRRAEWALSLPDLAAVVGHESSSSTLAAAPLYLDAGIPLVVPTATTPLLTPPGVFPLSPTDSVQGAFLARFATEQLEAAKATVFYVADEYGHSLRLGLEREFKRLGVELVEQVPIDSASDAGAMVRASLAHGVPDVIVAAVRYPEAWHLARVIKELAPEVQVMAGDGAYAEPAAIAFAGDAADSVYLSVFWHPDVTDSAGHDFERRFRILTGQAPGPADALVFDAIMVAASAIRAVGPRPDRVGRYLMELGAGRPPYEGVTGAIDFRPDRERPVLMVRPAGQVTRVVYQP